MDKYTRESLQSAWKATNPSNILTSEQETILLLYVNSLNRQRSERLGGIAQATANSNIDLAEPPPRRFVRRTLKKVSVPAGPIKPIERTAPASCLAGGHGIDCLQANGPDGSMGGQKQHILAEETRDLTLRR